LTAYCTRLEVLLHLVEDALAAVAGHPDEGLLDLLGRLLEGRALLFRQHR
jgi:hypothetical protein